MFNHLAQIVILFFVIFDPFMSFAVFSTVTQHMTRKERTRTAVLGIVVAALISYAVLLFGERLLVLFNTNLNDLKIAGGIILGLLGIKMTLGQPITEGGEGNEKSARAIAAIIGSPLLTGPAAITAIIITVHDYGRPVTALAVGLVLVFTGVLLVQATLVNRVVGKTPIQVISTILGLITVSWSVTFIRQGLGV
ncbi:MarC family protein [Candidatus Fermentibacteria bacterium]|nr:MarC family protein [Candidatus Fermentibacteria bacterium]